jgi:hypothetical protein
MQHYRFAFRATIFSFFKSEYKKRGLESPVHLGIVGVYISVLVSGGEEEEKKKRVSPF